MKLCQKLCVVLIVVSLIGFKIVQNSESRAAIQNGNVIDFWYVMCGVDVDGSRGDPGWMAGPDAVRGEWAYYSIAGYCGDQYYRVRLDDAAKQLQKVVQLIDAKRLQGALPVPQELAFESWVMKDNSAADVANLVDAILAARLKHIEETAPNRVQYIQESEELFNAFLEKSKRYWMTQLFEFTWLSGVVFLVAYPWLRNSGRAMWSVCPGIAPTVLFIPAYCGYASFVFTSCFPDGGVFYPDVLWWFPRLRLTQIDPWLVAQFPQVFDIFAQQPREIPRMAVTYFGGTSPVGLVAVGLIPAILLYVVWPVTCTLSQRLRRRRQCSHETMNPSVDDSSK